MKHNLLLLCIVLIISILIVGIRERYEDYKQCRNVCREGECKPLNEVGCECKNVFDLTKNEVVRSYDCIRKCGVIQDTTKNQKVPPMCKVEDEPCGCEEAPEFDFSQITMKDAFKKWWKNLF